MKCKSGPLLVGFELLMLWIVYSERSPTADLPTTAAFLGGLVAQEAIKMITKQYIPINSVCVVDLIGTWTGML